MTGTPSNLHKPPVQLSALPPGIVVGRSTEEASGQSSPKHQAQERIANLGGISLTPSRSNGDDRSSPLFPTLPPGMSISREALPPKLPPGVSLQPYTLPKLPPGISVETETNSPVPRLPPGISMEKAREEEKEESPRDKEQSSEEESKARSPRRAKASISYQEPPLNKKMRQGDNSQTLVGGRTLPGLSIEKSCEDTLRLNLPPGMMISKSVNEEKVPQLPAHESSGVVDQDEESSNEDSHPEEASNNPAKKKIKLKKKRGTPRASPDKFVPPPEDERPAPQQERVKSPSAEPKEPRAARGRSELARAKIRATLREDSLSDEEPAGARVPYRGRWKDDGVKTNATLPVQAELETAPSSKINRKAWQALGGEPSEDMNKPEESNGREFLTKEVSGGEKDSHCEQKMEDDGYETLVIKPKGKKRGRKSRETIEPSPAPESPASIDDLLQDDEETSRTKTQTSRQERLMEDLFDEGGNSSKKVTKGKQRRDKKESTDSEEPLSQRLSGRRRSGRSEGSVEEPSSLPHSSPEKNKPSAVIEPVRTEVEEVSEVFLTQVKKLDDFFCRRNQQNQREGVVRQRKRKRMTFRRT